MTRSTFAVATIVCLLASGLNAQQLEQPLSVKPISFNYNAIKTAFETEPVTSATTTNNISKVSYGASCGVPAPCAPEYSTPVACGCQPTCNSGCNSGCGGGSCGLGGCLSGLLSPGGVGGSGLGICSVVPGYSIGMQMLQSAANGGCTCDPWTLNSVLYGECEPCISVGGWFQAGYHIESNDLFNNRPDELNLHQSWLYLEKAATCDSPLGFRADIMYGIDGTDTQAFGNPNGSWDFDNGFDHGAYSWAFPQLYAELALNDTWSVKAGHFYTLVGYEVVTAPDNFFYSHAMTMYNSEPFTHTGVLATGAVSDSLTVYGGWTAGWDTGFDQLNDGSSWLGGFSYTLSDDASFTYISTAGNFGWRGDEAYSHSLLLDTALTDNLSYVFQSDLVRVGATGEDNIGINQYLFYSLSDCISLGSRFEWWKGDVLTGYAPHGAVLPAAGSLSYYAATFGANVKPTANVTIRPEFRWDWSPAADYDQNYFGVDAIFTF